MRSILNERYYEYYIFEHFYDIYGKKLDNFLYAYK